MDLSPVKTAPKKKVNYLNNKDILKEIHKSKMTYCFVEDPKHDSFDVIVEDLSEITDEVIAQARQNKAGKIQDEDYAKAMIEYSGKDYRNKPKQKDFSVDPDSFDLEDLTFRVMTYEHVPEAPGRKKTPKTIADERELVNFPPFKHYAYKNGELVEVARSHWNGDLETGHFDTEHGRMTNKLGTMFLKLVERYSHRANWRGYTYVDEMRGEALMQLSRIGLKFNETKSDNPFAYFTAAVNNSFTSVLNKEKVNQTIRDDILIDQGHLPSYGRQISHENEMRVLRESIENESGSADSFGDA